MNMSADIDMWNPNLIGTTTEPGTFVVYYGDDVMSHGVVNSVSVGARSHSEAHADIVVTLNPDVSQRIMEEVMTPPMALSVRADVNLAARFGPLRIKIHALCDVTAAVMVLAVPPVKAEDL